MKQEAEKTFAERPGPEPRASGNSDAPRSPRRPRIVLADDDGVILGLVRDLLSTDYDVVAQVSDGEALVRSVVEHCPDFAVVDVSMPVKSGIQATREITKSCRSVKVIMLSVHDELAYVDAAFEAGARGYVLKFAAYSELIPAIRAVATDGRYLSSRLR